MVGNDFRIDFVLDSASKEFDLGDVEKAYNFVQDGFNPLQKANQRLYCILVLIQQLTTSEPRGKPASGLGLRPYASAQSSQIFLEQVEW